MENAMVKKENIWNKWFAHRGHGVLLIKPYRMRRKYEKRGSSFRSFGS